MQRYFRTFFLPFVGWCKQALRKGGIVGVALFCVLSNCASATGEPDSISLGMTRLIYVESKDTHGQMVTFYNGTSLRFLLQSRILTVDDKTGLPGKPSMDFMINPPLKVSERQSNTSLRLLQVSSTLPQDRESVFYLSVKAIPQDLLSTAKERAPESGVKLTVATNWNIKLFFRPKGVPDASGGVKEAVKQVRFAWRNGVLEATNPTPYYLTLNHLSVGGVSLPINQLLPMLRPMSTHDYHFTEKVPIGSVSWRATDELGHNTEMVTASL